MWQEGDNIKSFDRICEVQSDKATVEITSRYDGKVMKLHHDIGGIVKVWQQFIDIVIVYLITPFILNQYERERNAKVGEALIDIAEETTRPVLSTESAEPARLTIPHIGTSPQLSSSDDIVDSSNTERLKKSESLLLVDFKILEDSTCIDRTRISTPFKLADIGEGIAEVELMQWFIKVRNLYCIYSDVSVSSIIFCMDDYIMDVTGRR